MVTINNIIYFITSYWGWMWSRSAWRVDKNLYTFFFTQDNMIEFFQYTPNFETVLIMFGVTILLLSYSVYYSTLYITPEAHAQEADTIQIRYSLQDDPDYAFFAMAPVEVPNKIKGFTIEYPAITRNNFCG